MFKAATVKSKNGYTRKAGRKMAAALIAKLGCPPKACWLFAAPARGMRALLTGISEMVETPNLIGCTTDGEISGEGFSTKSAVLGGIATDRIDFHVASAEGLSRDSEKAGRELAEKLTPETGFLQLFSDGITGNGCAILRGIESVMGEQLSITGGTAGDGGQFKQTFQFAGGKVLTDAVVAIGFTGGFHLGTGVAGGWSPVGLPKTVTRASGNVLYELNGEPALKVFERFLGKHTHKLPAIGVEYPLGLINRRPGGAAADYMLLRATMSVNHREGSIRFAGEIPQGAEVQLTCGDKRSILNASRKAARQALAGLNQARPAMIFCFSCMARKIVLGRRIREEIQNIRTVIGRDLPSIGFYSYGEFCPVGSHAFCYFHNETAIVTVIGI